jgi:hypothetical protein
MKTQPELVLLLAIFCGFFALASLGIWIENKFELQPKRITWTS